MSRNYMGSGHEELKRWNEFLNDRGKDGWELINLTLSAPLKAEAKEVLLPEYTLIFKRPVSQAFHGAS